MGFCGKLRERLVSWVHNNSNFLSYMRLSVCCFCYLWIGFFFYDFYKYWEDSIFFFLNCPFSGLYKEPLMLTLVQILLPKELMRMRVLMTKPWRWSTLSTHSGYRFVAASTVIYGFCFWAVIVFLRWKTMTNILFICTGATRFWQEAVCNIHEEIHQVADAQAEWGEAGDI